MTIKDKYNEYQKNITPDKEFLDNLAEKMELEKKRAGSRQKKLRIVYFSAAALCGSAAALIIMLNVSDMSAKKLPVVIDGETVSYSESVFTSDTLFTNDRPIPAQLGVLIKDDGSVVYKSDKSTFDYDGKLTDDQRGELARAVGFAKETDEQLSDDIEYYMLTTDGGDVVKFRIAGGILEVEEKNYKIP